MRQAPRLRPGADVAIRAGSISETMSAERREGAYALAGDLRERGLEVDVDLVERVPGYHVLTEVEWLLITVAVEPVRDVVLGAAQSMLRDRMSNRSGGRELGVVIYGPDEAELRRWSTFGDQPDRRGLDAGPKAMKSPTGGPPLLRTRQRFKHWLARRLGG